MAAERIPLRLGKERRARVEKWMKGYVAAAKKDGYRVKPSLNEAILILIDRGLGQ